MMTGDAPMRRAQFRLRTLFVAIAALGLVLGYVYWQREIVRLRTREIARIEQIGGRVSQSVPMYASDHFSGMPLSYYQRPAIPLVRRLLGDRPVGMVELPYDCPQTESTSLQQLFPELKTIVGPARPVSPVEQR